MNYLPKLMTVAALFLLASCQNGQEKAKENESPATETSEQEAEPAVIENSSETTKAVMEHHLKAFGGNDIDGIMEDYAEDAVLITPDTTLAGTEAIRAFFTQLVTLFPTEGTEFTLDKMEASGELGYIIWKATTPVIEVSFGTDTYFLDGGKITRQTFAGVITPKG